MSGGKKGKQIFSSPMEKCLNLTQMQLRQIGRAYLIQFNTSHLYSMAELLKRLSSKTTRLAIKNDSQMTLDSFRSVRTISDRMTQHLLDNICECADRDAIKEIFVGTRANLAHTLTKTIKDHAGC